MKCPKCKTKLPKKTKYCNMCGTKIKHTARNVGLIILVIVLCFGVAGIWWICNKYAKTSDADNVDSSAENHMPNSDNENKPHAPNPGSDGDTSDTFKLYQAAVEKTTESGSWVEDLSMTAAMKISNGNSKTKTKATIITHSEISNYYKDDISNLRISGSADMKILNQRYSWNVTYSDGIAHYQYTEPDTTSVDLKMDPNYFNFNSLTDDMLTNTKVLGNRIEFTVPGDKMTEAGLAAVNLMNGIKNLEYGDVNVNVTLNEKGGIDTITMIFDASMTYQGYDADVDYEIEYSFS